VLALDGAEQRAIGGEEVLDVARELSGLVHLRELAGCLAERLLDRAAVLERRELGRVDRARDLRLAPERGADRRLELRDLLLGRHRFLHQIALHAAQPLLHDEQRRDQGHEQHAAHEPDEDQLVLEAAPATQRIEHAGTEAAEASAGRHHGRPPSAPAAAFQSLSKRNSPCSMIIGQTWLLS